MNYDEIQAQRANENKAPTQPPVGMIKEPKKEEPISEAQSEYGRMKLKPVTIDSHADLFKYAVIIIAIIGIIAGIICGASIPAVEFDYRSFDTESDFNVALMFAVWAGTAISSLAIWAVYCVLDTLDKIHIEVKKIKNIVDFKTDIDIK